VDDNAARSGLNKARATMEEYESIQRHRTGCSRETDGLCHAGTLVPHRNTSRESRHFFGELNVFAREFQKCPSCVGAVCFPRKLKKRTRLQAMIVPTYRQ
jgi:hypothetical protein